MDPDELEMRRSYPGMKIQGPSMRAAIEAALYAHTQGLSPAAHETRNYLGALPYNSEGMLSALANKFGPEYADQILQQMPTMNAAQRAKLAEIVGVASADEDKQQYRERKGTYASQLPPDPTMPGGGAGTY